MCVFVCYCVLCVMVCVVVSIVCVCLCFECVCVVMFCVWWSDVDVVLYCDVMVLSDDDVFECVMCVCEDDIVCVFGMN